ncbi:E3 ubiquitin-protein ligase siah2 isoform X2 [Anabrus simplex]
MATTASTGSQTLQQVAQEELLKEMECPVCYKYMVLVIEECSNGHCICSSCRKNLSSCPQCKAAFSGHRNRLAESMAAKLIFPCQNADVGCSEMTNGSKLLEHQSVCSLRMYNCYIPKCEWIGRSYDILDHFKVEHNANLLNGKENTIVWRNVNFENSKKAYYLIKVNEALFIYVQEVIQKSNIFAHCVQYIGPKENASDFQYKLELISNDKKRQAVFVDSVSDDTMTKIFENGGGLQMTVQFIKAFVDDENKIVQKLEIIGMK